MGGLGRLGIGHNGSFLCGLGLKYMDEKVQTSELRNVLETIGLENVTWGSNNTPWAIKG